MYETDKDPRISKRVKAIMKAKKGLRLKKMLFQTANFICTMGLYLLMRVFRPSFFGEYTEAGMRGVDMGDQHAEIVGMTKILWGKWTMRYGCMLFEILIQNGKIMCEVYLAGQDSMTYPEFLSVLIKGLRAKMYKSAEKARKDMTAAERDAYPVTEVFCEVFI